MSLQSLMMLGKHLSEIFFILRRTGRYIITNGHRSSCKVPVILVRFQQNLNFRQIFRKKHRNMKFRETRHVRAELFLVDRHDETDSRFSQFCECALNRTSHTATLEALNRLVVQG